MVIAWKGGIGEPTARKTKKRVSCKKRQCAKGKRTRSPGAQQEGFIKSKIHSIGKGGVKVAKESEGVFT